MMKTKFAAKGISILLAAALVLSAFTMPAFPAQAADTVQAKTCSVTDSGTCGDNVTWSLGSDGTLTISGSGAMTEYTSTASYPWSSYKTTVKYIVIESGVTNIPWGAFYYFIMLKEVTIPDTVTSIGAYAFSYCSALTEITFPDSLTTIGSRAFYYTGLTQITIPESVTSIQSYAFYNCSSLSKVYFDGDAPALSSSVFSSAIGIFYHSSLDGWENALNSWSVPDGSVWYDLDSMISPADFTITAQLSLATGETGSITTNADDYLAMILVWSSSDYTVASVAQDGTVTGIGGGTAVITAGTEDGSYQASCTVTVSADTSSLPDAAVEVSDAAVSENISANNYTKWSSTVNSYIYENEDGTRTRVEYISGTGVCIETWSAEGDLQSSQTVSAELSLFGGFYSGEDDNFLVFGQTNSTEDDTAEVIRVVKYSKSWVRQDALNITDINTTEPFDAGSLRMTETDGVLYIHTSHEMYASSDGVNHQANLTLVIDESSMTLTDQNSEISNNSTGYVSHSFNQFIQTDGEYVYRADHGDGYPRGILISRTSTDTAVTNVSYTEAFTIQGTTGVNATGVSVGGFELSDNHCLLAGNSVDQSDADTYSASGTRNIFLNITDKSFGSSETVWITDYSSSDGVTVRTPQLVKVSSSIFLLLWEEVNASTVQTKAVLVNDDGKLLTDITALCVRLSDCQPILTEDGLVTWYVADGDEVTLCRVNPYRLADTPALAHTYEAVVTDPTCTADGYTTYTCSVCGDSYVEDATAAIGHTEGDPVVTTTDTKITYAYYCTVCSELLRTVTEAVEDASSDGDGTGSDDGSGSSSGSDSDSGSGSGSGSGSDDGSDSDSGSGSNSGSGSGSDSGSSAGSSYTVPTASVSVSKVSLTGATEAEVAATLLMLTDDGDTADSSYSLLQAKAKKTTTKSIKLTWKKVSGAVTYVVYANQCGSGRKLQKYKTVTGTSLNIKKIAGRKVAKGKYYKFLVVALDKDGKVIATSKTVHAATKGGSVTNEKSLTIYKGKKKVSTLTIKTGKTVKIKTKSTLQDQAKKLRRHRKTKYESGNTQIATVTANGKIKAKAKGTCYIYAYAQNGVSTKVKVTVE